MREVVISFACGIALGVALLLVDELMRVTLGVSWIAGGYI